MSRIVLCDDGGIAEAARCIFGGGTLVFPTDTVYGLGCDPYNAAAVRKVYGIKGRDFTKPLPVLASSTDAARRIAELDRTAERLAGALWPGAATLVLPLADRRLEESMRPGARIAVRVPAGRCVCALLGKCGLITGTSANRSGDAASGDPKIVAGNLEGFDMMLDGGTTGGAESTIIECKDGKIRILREGAIPAGRIRDIV